MNDLLFDTPWWLPTLLLIMGVVLFITGNNRQEFRIRTLGIILLALGIAVIAVSYFVDTDREKAEKGTRRLVQAAVVGDWNTFQNYLDPKASVAVQNAGVVAPNRDRIMLVAKAGAQQFGLKEAHVTSLDSSQAHSEITITIDVLTEQTMHPYPVPSTWQFQWLRTPDGLRIYRITNLKVGNETGQAAQTKFPKP
jgi:hypothetical protein